MKYWYIFLNTAIDLHTATCLKLSSHSLITACWLPEYASASNFISQTNSVDIYWYHALSNCIIRIIGLWESKSALLEIFRSMSKFYVIHHEIVLRIINFMLDNVSYVDAFDKLRH